MGKKEIVNKILSDAEAKSVSYLEEMITKSDAIVAKAESEVAAREKVWNDETSRMVKEISERKDTVARLDKRKVLLGARSKIVDSVFSEALSKVKSLDKETLNALLVGMVSKFAENGDEVVLGESQFGVLTKSDVAAIAKSKGINLTLSDDKGDFDGVMLRGLGSNKNLTFDDEIAELKSLLETQIAKEIFG